jgi:polyisoprenoid-binding protein YceI
MAGFAGCPAVRAVRTVGLLPVLLLLVFLPLHASPAVAQASYAFDASKSSLEINVYKEGLFSAFGHNHFIAAKDFSGSAEFEPTKIESASVTLRVDAKSLTAIDPGESSSDRQQVQATMLGEEVLDTKRYPEISFRSTGVTHIQQQGSGWRVTLTGLLELHGTQKPVAFPLTVRIEDGELIAEGEVSLLQSDYGIQPIRIAGGAVKVKDRLRIHLTIHARH